MNRNQQNSPTDTQTHPPALLVANRGEIACRIFNTARKLGMECVAIYSDADRSARHVRVADRSVRIGLAPSKNSYLNIDAIIEAAKGSGASLIHPGYGFLSENEHFAARVIEAGLTWVGPPPAAIKLLGDKVASKEKAKSLGIPLLPSIEIQFAAGGEIANKHELIKFIKENGYPLMVKAAGGGGGRGMRRVFEESELIDAIMGSSREAENFFGNPAVFIERLVTGGRHLEVQIVGDQLGNVRHIFDRDCSLQRRHQKVIEEAPALSVEASTREKLFQYSVQLARAASYSSLGTVEYLIDQAGNPYFMEVNSRLQVEHTVTEMITGLDLVELQIRIALGESIDNMLGELKSEGHAIQARVCAEAPRHDFAAASGKLVTATFPRQSEAGEIRVDSGFERFDSISHYYDSLVAKVICFAESRPAAIELLLETLAGTALFGVDNNIEYLLALLADCEFRDNCHNLESAGRILGAMLERPLGPSVAQLAAAVSELIEECVHATRSASPELNMITRSRLGWSRLALGKRFAAGASRAIAVTYGNEESRKFRVSRLDQGVWGVAPHNSTSPSDLKIFRLSNAQLDRLGCLRCSLLVDDKESPVTAIRIGDELWLNSNLGIHRVTLSTPHLKIRHSGEKASGGQIKSLLPGSVLRVLVNEGAEVKAGDVLLTLESMKMEHPITAPGAGRVVRCLVKNGDLVQAGGQLFELELS